MRIFIAGASGAVGQPLVRQLAAAGHEVTGMTRTPEKAAVLRELGAEPVVADALDAAAVMAAVQDAKPEVVVHQLTAIGPMNTRNLDAAFVATNRLRTEGTDNLVAAARAAGARRFVAQGFAPWSYKREGGPAKAEDAPLETDPPKHVEQTLAAIRHLEAAVTGAKDLEGIVLRYGGFYGPGTGLARGGDMLEAVAKGRFPIVGDGGGVWSLIHIEDAAAATVAAIERGRPGVYNVADDEPAPVSVWLPELANVLETKPPRRVPVWLGRIAAGDAGVSLFTQIRGASNAKAKRELGWRPRYASWREGFRFGLAAGPAGVQAAARAA
jgi:nucleoside-diphosphate-sugar epimerase